MFEDINIEELNEEIQNPNDNGIYFVLTYKGELVGSIKIYFSDQIFYNIYKHPYRAAYISFVCSFSRWRPISNLGTRKVGQKLWAETIKYIQKYYNDQFDIVVWLNSTEDAHRYHIGNGMISSLNFLHNLRTKNSSNIYDIFEEDEYDQGLSNLFFISPGKIHKYSQQKERKNYSKTLNTDENSGRRRSRSRSPQLNKSGRRASRSPQLKKSGRRASRSRSRSPQLKKSGRRVELELSR
jgi:hypothetical protein